MKIAVLSIGDELTDGRIVNGNAAAISAALLERGLRVWRQVTVGDDEEEIVAVLEELAGGCDAVVATGGLGPTDDDRTARAVARATGRPLVPNREAREHLRSMCGKLANLVFCPLDDTQELFPAPSTLIPNPNGTACGFSLDHNGCRMFFLPGVPAEMAPMLAGSVIPPIEEKMPRRRVIRSAHFNIFGPCEAEVDQLLAEVARPESGLRLGICVSYPTMRVTLQAESDRDETCRDMLDAAGRELLERVGEYVYSTGTESMEEAVGKLLHRRGMTLSLAESCTGGMISAAVTAVPGSSAWFLEGALTYGNNAKMRRLGVDAGLLVEYGAVSEQVALAMAGGIRSGAGSDIGLAVTGIAGPDGGTDEKPVGTVFIALAHGGGCEARRFAFSGSRSEIRTMTMWSALDWLRRHLAGC